MALLQISWCLSAFKRPVVPTAVLNYIDLQLTCNCNDSATTWICSITCQEHRVRKHQIYLMLDCAALLTLTSQSRPVDKSGHSVLCTSNPYFESSSYCVHVVYPMAFSRASTLRVRASCSRLDSPRHKPTRLQCVQK